MSQDEVRSRIRRRRRNTTPGTGFSDTGDGSPIEEADQNIHIETPPLSEVENGTGTATSAPPDFTPRSRMKEVSTQANTYELEYRMKLVNRMLMRNVPLDEMARELGVSVRTIQRDRSELYERLRESAQKLSIDELVGKGVSFYDEVMGMALRGASSAKAPLNMRLGAMRTALAAHNDKTKFLDTAGVLDVLKFRLVEAKSSSDMEKLVQFTKQLLNEEKGIINQNTEGTSIEELEDEEIHLL